MHTGDFKLCIQLAEEFYRVSQEISRDPLSLVDGKMYPYAVNIALSCELYMKALLIYFDPDNAFVYGHDLKKLFDSLPAEIRKDVTNSFEEELHELGDTIETFLLTQKDAFVDWRYAFENGKDGRTLYYTGFQCFVKFLRNEIKKRIQ